MQKFRASYLGSRGTSIFNTELVQADTWQQPKRTVDKDHWKWAVRKRQTLFEDAIFNAFDGFYMDGGDLLYDDSHLEALVNSPGWAGNFALDVTEWRVGKTPQHLRDVLKKFLRWGKPRFDLAKPPYIPGMPNLNEFLQTKPWAGKPVKRNSKSRPQRPAGNRTSKSKK